LLGREKEMSLITRNDLKKTYKWTPLYHEDPRVSGAPDPTPVNRGEGYEILYLVAAIAEAWGLTTKEDCLKIERLIHKVPVQFRGQIDITTWICRNWSRTE
jgi:hypothetical protein